MARRFAKVSEEEIEEAFFYPSDLVNTKTTIPLRVGEERWIYTSTLSRLGIYPPLFTSPSGDSCILLRGRNWSSRKTSWSRVKNQQTQPTNGFEPGGPHSIS